jgi:hypothetical protein
MRSAAGVCLLLVLLFPVHAGGQQTQTLLADVLRQNSVAVHLNSVSHLDEAITGYATLNSEREFLIAYYLVTPRNELRFPLLLARFDKRSNRWQESSLDGLKVNTSEGSAPTQQDCIGSAVRFEGNGDWYYLDLHWTPSAGCMVVLKQNLTVHQTIAGWKVAMFKSGVSVYEGNMIQFAPVHPATLYVYDPVTRDKQKIYPPKRDPFRKEFSGRLERLIDVSRCKSNNWRCDPNEFESSIVEPIAINDATHALAFRVVFGTQGFIPRDEAAASGEQAVDRYVYVYQLKPQRWREFSADDVEPSFGTDSLAELLTPRKLRRVFAGASP